MNKRETSWVHLYNCLILVSSNYEELEKLENGTFQVMDEIETKIEAGLNERSLSLYYENNWINESLKNELREFKKFVEAIDSCHWNNSDFSTNEDWCLARTWANSLLKIMGLEKTGIDLTGSITFFIDD